MENTFKIYNKAKQYVGCVMAKSEGHAANKAVERKLVVGRKQIGKIELLPYDDFYEQDWSDIYG